MCDASTTLTQFLEVTAILLLVGFFAFLSDMRTFWESRHVWKAQGLAFIGASLLTGIMWLVAGDRNDGFDAEKMSYFEQTWASCWLPTTIKTLALLGSVHELYAVRFVCGYFPILVMTGVACFAYFRQRSSLGVMAGQRNRVSSLCGNCFPVSVVCASWCDSAGCASGECRASPPPVRSSMLRYQVPMPGVSADGASGGIVLHRFVSPYGFTGTLRAMLCDAVDGLQVEAHAVSMMQRWRVRICQAFPTRAGYHCRQSKHAVWCMGMNILRRAVDCRHRRFHPTTGSVPSFVL